MTSLKLNKQTDCYEATIILKIDSEIVRRELYKHIEDNNIDIADATAMWNALQYITGAKHWVDHPRAAKVIAALPETKEQIMEPVIDEEEKSVYRVSTLSEEQKIQLRELALQTPEEEWDSLLTPLPDPPGDSRSREMKIIYHRRSNERTVLAALKKENQAVAPEKLSVIANAVNGSRMR